MENQLIQSIEHRLVPSLFANNSESSKIEQSDVDLGSILHDASQIGIDISPVNTELNRALYFLRPVSCFGSDYPHIKQYWEKTKQEYHRSVAAVFLCAAIAADGVLTDYALEGRQGLAYLLSMAAVGVMRKLCQRMEEKEKVMAAAHDDVLRTTWI